MDYSFEIQQIVQALNSQAVAMQELTNQLARQNEINQQILELLITDGQEEQPLRDMEGNPL